MSGPNLAASVHGRLRNRARADARPFQELLQYFAMERFLYRLSRSEHAARFILKGALMMRVWEVPTARPTRDIDLLGRMSNEVADLEAAAREICEFEVEPDGMVYDASSVVGRRIKEDAEYQGVRVRLVARLGKARCPIQLDIGFGDAVTPAAQELEYPVLLDHPAPRLRGYPRESVVAEKFEAMVFLGRLNSRMKDFYDLWFLARSFEFDGPALSAALRATFANRGTALTPEPIALADSFVGGPTARAQWDAFRRKAGLVDAPPSLPEVAQTIAGFLLPVVAACISGQAPFGKRWLPSGLWVDG